MPFFPTMFVLLDVARMAKGLTDLQFIEHYAPEEDTQGRHWFPASDHRHRPLRELVCSLPEDLAWLNERGVTQEDGLELQPHESERVLKFLLRGSNRSDFIDVEITEEEQIPLSLEQRKYWAVASINFYGDGWNWKFTLAETHPAHSNMQMFLNALQPVHGRVCANTISPAAQKSSSDFGYFPAIWTQASRNCFLGSELVRRIPPELLTQEAGLAYISQLGEGVWITLLEDDRHQDEAMLERHDNAIHRINAFMPPASPFDPSTW